MHGQSEYTPSKQMQLKSLLEACYWAWSKPHAWAAPERYFIDCMAGSGHDKQGEPGSPLILQDYAKQFEPGFCVWCDVERKHTRTLATLMNDTYTCLFTGRYQVEVLNYIKTNLPRNAMGLVYLDDNGCQQIWDDDGFLEYIMIHYPYLDIAIHFSETAWKRNAGAGNDWALQETVMGVLETIVAYKPEAVIYAPVDNRQHWRLVYGVRSGKMNLTGQKRIKLRDYIKGRLDQGDLFAEGG